MVRLFILVVLVAIAATRPAYAYIDPGTASIALQAVIGAIAVASFYFRSTIARVIRILRPGRHESEGVAPHQTPKSGENNADDA